MKIQHLMIAVVAAVSSQAMAAVTAEEATQLGTSLTRYGAEAAGNKVAEKLIEHAE